MLSNPKKVYNEIRLRNLKRAKLKFKESQLQLQQKQGAGSKVIMQTMKEIQTIKSELNKN